MQALKGMALKTQLQSWLGELNPPPHLKIKYILPNVPKSTAAVDGSISVVLWMK